jgi:hypothetical protein
VVVLLWQFFGQVGFTITLYRHQGFPWPDSLAKSAGE